MLDAYHYSYSHPLHLRSRLRYKRLRRRRWRNVRSAMRGLLWKIWNDIFASIRNILIMMVSEAVYKLYCQFKGGKELRRNWWLVTRKGRGCVAVTLQITKHLRENTRKFISDTEPWFFKTPLAEYYLLNWDRLQKSLHQISAEFPHGIPLLLTTITERIFFLFQSSTSKIHLAR